MQWQNLKLTIPGLRAHYRSGDFTPTDLLQYLGECIERHERDCAERGITDRVWLYRLSEAELERYIDDLTHKDFASSPLWGVPFAIKDNIDLAGVPTTAACPAYAYEASESAFVVRQLIEAGAIPLGKTNLDQFATGLVGVRSPYGICRNALNEAYISGGSSSGSAVAVARHWVSFALGTDTAGSGRVPAAFNNLCGLKPSRGLLSTRGVVPACRSLDCVSILALDCDDANTVFDVAATFDEREAYARRNPYGNARRYYGVPGQAVTVGVPRADQLAFFGDREAQDLFADALARLRAHGVPLVEIDFQPFLDAAALLYQGPWVTERYLVARDILAQGGDSVLPVIREIVEPGAKLRASDVFQAQYQLRQYAQKAGQTFARVAAIVTPTTGTAYTLEQVEADPIALNSNLGYYTNFMNLLDFAAVAIPHAFKASGVGCGLTLFGPSFSDKRLLGIAADWQNLFALPTGCASPFTPQAQAAGRAASEFVDVVVCGAHLEGLPLNWQLRERGAKLLGATRTSAHYQLFALPGGPPKRPAMSRVDAGGRAIEVEVWRVPLAEFGSFVAEIPQPLGIGKVELKDGRWCSGFICEGNALASAENISRFGGWRAYLAGLQTD